MFDRKPKQKTAWKDEIQALNAENSSRTFHFSSDDKTNSKTERDEKVTAQAKREEKVTAQTKRIEKFESKLKSEEKDGLRTALATTQPQNAPQSTNSIPENTNLKAFIQKLQKKKLPSYMKWMPVDEPILRIRKPQTFNIIFSVFDIIFIFSLIAILPEQFLLTSFLFLITVSIILLVSLRSIFKSFYLAFDIQNKTISIFKDIKTRQDTKKLSLTNAIVEKEIELPALEDPDIIHRIDESKVQFGHAWRYNLILTDKNKSHTIELLKNIPQIDAVLYVETLSKIIKMFNLYIKTQQEKKGSIYRSKVNNACD